MILRRLQQVVGVAGNNNRPSGTTTTTSTESVRLLVGHPLRPVPRAHQPLALVILLILLVFLLN
jgi:hypothetical protein